MQIQQHSRTVLELEKILRQVASFAALPDSKDRLMLLTPVSDRATAERMLRETDDAITLSARFGTPVFEAFWEPSSDLKRAQDGASLGFPELLNMARIVRQGKALLGWRRRCEKVESSLSEYMDRLSIGSRPSALLLWEQEVSRSILGEDQMADEASETLKNIRTELKTQSQRLEKSLLKYMQSDQKGYLQDHFTTMRNNRYVLPVKAEYQSQIPGLVHGASKSGGTVFIEPMQAVEANNAIRILLAKEEEEIARILLRLTQQAASLSEPILQDFQILCHLDQCFAKAKYAQSIDGVCPTLNDRGVLHLKQARHPLIDVKSVVPIDLTLGREYRSLIITGPNTGGKTVALKTAGLLTCMALCGLPIPAKEGSQVAVFSQILADIGDEQSIEESLSTFSSHLRIWISILREMDKDSLVLLDELGSGTDPKQGAALALAVIEAIHRTGARLIATTHYPELTSFALTTQGFENASCEFDLEKMRPTYHLRIGQPGSSNAFAVSRNLGLPEEILQRAQQYLSKEDKRFEQSVQILEKMEKGKEAQWVKAKEEREEAKKLRKDMEQRVKITNQKIEEKWESTKEQASYLLEEMQEKINRLVIELEEYRKEKGPAKEAGRELQRKLDQLKEKANPVIESVQEEYRLPRPLHAGDLVLLRDMQKEARIVKLEDRSEQALVQMGAMKLRTPYRNLKLLEKEKEVKKPSTVTITGKKEIDTIELDIRGKDVEEGLCEMDRFIDHCVLNHLQQCRIIHGKGTGKLRSAIGKRLKHHPSVKQYRLGNFGEGDSGVTIIELK